MKNMTKIAQVDEKVYEKRMQLILIISTYTFVLLLIIKFLIKY